MKKHQTSIFIILILLVSCKVDQELEPSFKNDITQFSFIKMDFGGTPIEKNFSLYTNNILHQRFELTDVWVQRTYAYTEPSTRESPYSNYYDIRLLVSYFNTRGTTDLTSRIGEKYAIEEDDNRDNYIGLGFEYDRQIYSINYSGQDSVTYLNIKDTVIDGREYELTHLLLDDLTMVGEQNNTVDVRNLELRQVLPK
jgi:hypothetical protein